MKAFTISTWAIAVLLLAGCGGGGGEDLPATVDAEGTVTLDGEAVVGASIVCVPEKPGKYPAHASSGSGGSFALKAFEAKEGAVPGSYKVQVSRTIEISGRAPTSDELGDDGHMSEEEKAGVLWTNDLPKKYSTVVTSDIVVEVPESGSTDIEIKLVSD